jgi:hypothetical protein
MRPRLAATILRTLWLVVCVVFLPLVVSVSNLPVYLPLGGATASLAIQAVFIVGAVMAIALAAAFMLRKLSSGRFAASALLAALLGASGALGIVRGDVPVAGVTGLLLVLAVLITAGSVWGAIYLSGFQR